MGAYDQVAIAQCVEVIVRDVALWGPANVMKDFPTHRGPPALVVLPLGARLGDSYIAFEGRNGVVVKRKGL
jgi:hypothetical protein